MEDLLRKNAANFFIYITQQLYPLISIEKDAADTCLTLVSHLFALTEKYTPQRSGLRERKRAESPRQKEPSVTEAWVPEEEIELWEIKQFGEK